MPRLIVNRCAKFGETNVVTGVISYHSAEFSRNSIIFCTVNGKSFELDNSLSILLKQSRMWLSYNSMSIILLSCIVILIQNAVYPAAINPAAVNQAAVTAKSTSE